MTRTVRASAPGRRRMSESRSGTGSRARHLRAMLWSIVLIAAGAMVLPLTAYVWTAAVQAQEATAETAGTPQDQSACGLLARGAQCRGGLHGGARPGDERPDPEPRRGLARGAQRAGHDPRRDHGRRHDPGTARLSPDQGRREARAPHRPQGAALGGVRPRAALVHGGAVHHPGHHGPEPAVGTRRC